MPEFERRPTRATRAKHAKGGKPSIEARLLTAMEAHIAKGSTFGSISVEALMAETGMTRGTFYKHFRDKGELVARLTKHVTEEIADSVGPFLSNAAESDPQNMRKAVVQMVQTFKRHQAVFAALNDLAPHDPTVALLYRSMIESVCQRSRSSINIVQDAGRARMGVTANIVDILTWMVFLYCTRFVGELDEEGISELTQSLGYICTTVVFSDEADIISERGKRGDR